MLDDPVQLNKIIMQLRDALIDARQHLVDCDWGGDFNTEVAMGQRLPDKINEALKNSEVTLG